MRCQNCPIYIKVMTMLKKTLLLSSIAVFSLHFCLAFAVPVLADQAKPEQAKLEPAKPEPAKPEQAQAQPAKSGFDAPKPPLSNYLSEKERAALNLQIQKFDQGRQNSPIAGDGSLMGSPEVLGKVRMAVDLRANMRPAPQGLVVTSVNEDGVKGVWQDMPEVRKDKVLLYLHGGGYTIGSPAMASVISVTIADVMKVRCFSVDYRLAPEHPFPAALDDAVAAYKWLLKNGYQAENIVVSGESAGGGLSLALLLKLRDEGIALPAGAFLISPWTDLAVSFEAPNICYDPMFKPGALKKGAELYLKDTPATNPYASPYYGDFKGLPPMLFQVGSNEVLYDDTMQAARKAGMAGVYVRVETWPGYFHVFQMYKDRLAGGAKALHNGAAFLNDAINKKLLEE